MNVSFAGCGFLGIYHIGVGVCIQKYAPHLLVNQVSGASAGAIAACCLVCDIPIDVVAKDMLNLIKNARTGALGPFSPSCDVQSNLYNNLNKVLPEDAHIKANGNVHISLTRVSDGKNIIVSKFENREDLLQAIMASSFIPIFSGFIPPKLHGEYYIDGGFSNNLPTLDDNTITVSPFCGESDICPRDLSSQLFYLNYNNTSIELSKQNACRFAKVIWPPKFEALANLCQQGFNDALRYLQRNRLINCDGCLIQSSDVFFLKDGIDYECQDCKGASEANLPETVLCVFQDAIEAASKEYSGWKFYRQKLGYETISTLPFTGAVQLALLTMRKLLNVLPSTIRLAWKIWSQSVIYIVHSISNIALNKLYAKIWRCESTRSINL